MSEELDEVQTSEAVQPQVEQEPSPETKEEVVEEVETEVDPGVEARRQLTARAKKAEAALKVLEAKLSKSASENRKTLDVEDYIDISASLEGLDGREKERLAKEHKLTGRPLKEIREDEDFKLWQSAYKQKVEKDRSLKPSGTQTISDKPTGLAEQINSADMAKKEELLKKYGLYRDPRPRSDGRRIG